MRRKSHHECIDMEGLTKGDVREIIVMINEYLDSYMAKYTPGEAALMHFEEECMQGYSGQQTVTHATIRRLVHAVAAAVADKSKPTTVTYPDGSVMFTADEYGVTFYDTSGNRVFRIDENGTTFNMDVRIEDDLYMSTLAETAVTSVVDNMTDSVEDVENIVEEIWA